MGTVEMHIAGARSMEAVGHGIGQRWRSGGELRISRRTRVAPGTGLFRITFQVLPAVDRIAVVERVDLIQKGQFNDVAKPRAQRWPRQRGHRLVGIRRRRLVVPVEAQQLRNAFAGADLKALLGIRQHQKSAQTSVGRDDLGQFLFRQVDPRRAIDELGARRDGTRQERCDSA
jgi:hypothetical protein